VRKKLVSYLWRELKSSDWLLW